MAHYKLYSHVDKYNHCVTAMHGLKHPVNVIQASLSEVLQHFLVKHFQNTPNTRTYIFFEIGVVAVICFTVC